MVTGRTLANKPLGEAIYELHWVVGHPEAAASPVVDPQAGVLPGILYDQLRGSYPIAERLPAATVPHELASFIVQQRFRSKPNGWPLFQVGPGVVTLNEVDDYEWSDFFRRVAEIVDALWRVHPNAAELRINSANLRYINTVAFDFDANDVFEFISDEFGLQVGVKERLEEVGAQKLRAVGIDSRFSFACVDPPGEAQLRFARGKRDDEDALVWELSMQIHGDDIPQNSEALMDWTQSAHSLIEDWFFGMLSSRLLEQFS